MPRSRLGLPSSNDPDVAIVVAATRDAARLERCLRAIVAAGDDGVGIQVVLCANAAEEEVLDLVDATDGALVVRSTFDIGTAATWNLGVAATSARRFAIVHEDAFVEPGWLGVLWEQLERDPAAGVVGPMLLRPDGSVLSVGNVLWRDGHPWGVDAETAPGLELTTATPVDYVASATMMAERSLWDEIDGFDEGTFPGVTVDADFCTAAWATGRRVMTVPAARSVHAQGAAVLRRAGWRYSRAFREFLFRLNMERFQRRWAALLADHLPAPQRRPDVDTVRASLRRAAEQGRHPGRLEALPSRTRVLTGGFEGTRDVPPEVEKRARALLAERLEEFADWLADGRDDLYEYVPSLRAAIARKDDDVRGVLASARAERSRADAAERELDAQRARGDALETALRERDATLTWRLRARVAALPGVTTAWGALRRLRLRRRQ